MVEQVVQFVQYQSDIKFVPLTDQFKFCPERGHVWLQRAAIWILRKLDCNALTTHVDSVRIAFNTDDFMHNLIAQDREMVNIYHERGERLLLGNEEFSKLVNCDVLNNHPLSFSSRYHYVERYERRNIGGYEMRVTVIPWMKGMLVLPKGWDK